MSNSEDMDHDHKDQGGDDDLQPPDQNQPKILSPCAQSDHGLPDTDTEEDDEGPYGPHICILARPPPPQTETPRMLPHPPNPQGSMSTGGARQRSPPAPIVPPRPPLPPRNPPAPRQPRMSYEKGHPRAPITPYTRPQRTIKPVIKKDLVYGDRSPVQIEQEIRMEKDFVQKILKQGFELPQPITTMHSEPGPSGHQWTEPREVPVMGSSSEEESEPSPMKEDTSGEKSDKHANKVKWSAAFISELMAHATEFLDVLRLYRDIKKMPAEDQDGWRKACDEEIQSLTDRKVWKLVDLPPGRKPIKC